MQPSHRPRVGCIFTAINGSFIPDSFKNTIYRDYAYADDIKEVLQNLFDNLNNGIYYNVILRPTGGGASSIAHIYRAGVNVGFIRVNNHQGIDYVGMLQSGGWTWNSYIKTLDVPRAIELLYMNTYGSIVATHDGNDYVLTTKGDLTKHVKSGGVTTSADGQATVTFATPFEKTPHIVASPIGEASDVIFGVKVGNITKTGFTIKSLRLQSGSNQITAGNNTIQWIATDLYND